MKTLDKIDKYVQENHLLQHPFYKAWTAGDLSQEVLSVYAKQYFAHVDAFPRYVSATHANCSQEPARKFLLENLIEEEHGSVSHRELWLRFAEGLGVPRKEVEATARFPEAQAIVETFLKAAKSSYAAGLGVLYAYESQIPSVARSKIDGLQEFYGIREPQTLAFFSVHEKADVEHSRVSRNLIEALSEEEQLVAESAAKAAVDVLNRFLDRMQVEAGLDHCA